MHATRRMQQIHRLARAQNGIGQGYKMTSPWYDNVRRSPDKLNLVKRRIRYRARQVGCRQITLVTHQDNLMCRLSPRTAPCPVFGRLA